MLGNKFSIIVKKNSLKVNIEEVLTKHFGISQYAYILHDKDDITPHYHIYIKLKSSVLFDNFVIARWFKLSEKEVVKVNFNIIDFCKYVFHISNGKTQYDLESIVTNYDTNIIKDFL